MSLPDFASFFYPTLSVFTDGAARPLSEVYEAVASALSITDEERAARLSDGRTPVYISRTHWAVTYLHRAGALQRTGRGVYRITERGRVLLQNSPGRITVKDLGAFPEFREFAGARRTPHRSLPARPDAAGIPESPTVSPLERLESVYEEIRESLRSEILERLRQVTPSAFERIVVDLLLAMGYGGSVADAGETVGRAGDEGVDGVIKEDKLGLDVVYVQAKRWEQNVGRPQVQAFAGALEGKRARKGVFITTSSFTPDARQYVQQIEKKIVLIDGRQLAELMIDHDVGVAVTHTYKLKRVDSDYFEED